MSSLDKITVTYSPKSGVRASASGTNTKPNPSLRPKGLLRRVQIEDADRTLKDLETLLEVVKKCGGTDTIDCTCDKCAPQIYNHEDDDGPHKRVTSTLRNNAFKNRTIAQANLAGPGTYESMHLARACIEYFDKPFKQINDTQRGAMRKFQKVVGRNLDALNAEDPRTAGLQTKEIEQILRYYNRIFFFDSLPQPEFNWLNELEKDFDPEVRGSSATSIEEGRVWVWLNADARMPEGTGKHTTALYRLSVLLHEMLHCYLNWWSCRECSTYDENIGVEGHGRAFQLVLDKLDKRLLDLLEIKSFLHITRKDIWFEHLKELMMLPSACDMKSLGWWETDPAHVVETAGTILIVEDKDEDEWDEGDEEDEGPPAKKVKK